MSGENDQNILLNRIREELSSLAKFVDKTRKGIDSLESTVKLGSEKFPEASIQLSAVTGDLENAANNIMNILEGLMTEQEKVQAHLAELYKWASSLAEKEKVAGEAIIKNLERIHEKTKTEMMEIFSNMSFQDLTGQKLKKVIGSLSVIESKVLELALNFGYNDASKHGEKAEILNQLKSAEQVPIKQDVVDKILRELGASA